jgi:hypothetical protein
MAVPDGHRDVYGNLRSLSGGRAGGMTTTLWAG